MRRTKMQVKPAKPAQPAKGSPDFTAAYLATDADRVVEYEVRSGQVTGYTAASPSKVDELANQDAVAVFAHGALRTVLAVADGLGGHPGGDQASQLALEVLAAELERTPDEPEAVASAIQTAFQHANDALLAQGEGAGTTLVVAEVDGKQVRTYHVGDSVALLTGGRGLLKLQTVAHSPVGYALQAGWIDEAQAMVHEERHLVSNVLGDKSMRVEVGKPVALRPRDTLLLASDGLFDNLRVQELAVMVRRGALGSATVGIVEECRRRMMTPDEELSKPDDLAILMYRPIGGEPRGTQKRSR